MRAKKYSINEVYSALLYIVLHFTQYIANIYAMQIYLSVQPPL